MTRHQPSPSSLDGGDDRPRRAARRRVGVGGRRGRRPRRRPGRRRAWPSRWRRSTGGVVEAGGGAGRSSRRRRRRRRHRRRRHRRRRGGGRARRDRPRRPAVTGAGWVPVRSGGSALTGSPGSTGDMGWRRRPGRRVCAWRHRSGPGSALAASADATGTGCVDVAATGEAAAVVGRSVGGPAAGWQHAGGAEQGDEDEAALSRSSKGPALPPRRDSPAGTEGFSGAGGGGRRRGRRRRRRRRRGRR